MKTSNEDTPTKLRRIFPGIYCDREKHQIEVIMVTKNIDTGEKLVICKRRFHDEPKDFFVISQSSFCEMIDTDDGPVPKYIRQTQFHESENELRMLDENGFPEERRLYRRKHPQLNEGELPVLRELHKSKSYYDYARELCFNRLTDLRRIKLCTESKRFYGVSAQEYRILNQDLRFIGDCFKTVLKEYYPLFVGRYGSKQLSIRRYAEENNMNRGSVTYAEEKMFRALAKELEARDKADGVTRIGTTGNGNQKN